MAVTVQLRLNPTQLSYQEPVTCEAELSNRTTTPLRQLNLGHERDLPALLLSDLRSGVTTKHVRLLREQVAPTAATVVPNGVAGRSFPLSEVLQFPAPGAYELQALYTWDGGAAHAISAPVRVDIRPVDPLSMTIAPLGGGASLTSFAAFVGRVSTGQDELELRLATLSTLNKPRVTNSVAVCPLKTLITPCLSVPANTDAGLQWLAWVDNDRLYCLPHLNGSTTEPQVIRLPGPNFKLIPPLLLQPNRPQARIPGAVALLFQPTADETGCRLLPIDIQVAAKGESLPLPAVTLEKLNPTWAQTAYLSDMSRHTFFVTRGPKRGISLHVSRWSPRQPPAAPAALASFDARLLAGDVLVTSTDWVRGVFLVQLNSLAPDECAMIQWIYGKRGTFDSADPIVINFPRSAEIAEAVVRVNEVGAAYGLLRSFDSRLAWRFVQPDGTTSPAPATVRRPADVMFRYGGDPTIIYADPGRGFQFAKP